MNWKTRYEAIEKSKKGWEERATEEGKSLGQREIAQAIIDIFEIQDSYPDSTKQQMTWAPGSHGLGEYKMTDVPVYGVNKFIDDILNAKDAAKSNASLKLIRKTLKKKEEK